MATDATLDEYANGYPQVNGNHKKILVFLNGPTEYVAGGVGIPAIAHVANIHEIQAISCDADLFVHVIVNTNNNFFKASDVKLVFIDKTDALEPDDDTDLSAVRVRLVLEGTN